MRLFQKTLVCAMLLLAPGLLTAGCATSQKQVRYFAAANIDPRDSERALTFYRLTINARSTNSETEFLAGFYDADAVRQLYGEVNPSEQSHPMGLDPNAGHYKLVFTSDGSGGRWREVPDTCLYTILYGTDASELATQIKTLASEATGNEDISALVRAVLAGDESLKVKKAQVDVAAVKQQTTLLYGVLTDLARDLNDDTKSASVLEAGKKIVAALSASMGYPAPDIKTMADLQDAYSVLQTLLLGAK